MKKILSLLICFTFVTPSFANMVVKGPLWQKYEISSLVQEKVQRALESYVEPKDYFVDVLIEIEDPERPDFNQKPNPKGNIRLSNAGPKKIPEDYILFSKLGLEAPLINDFSDMGIVGGGKKPLPEYEQLWEYNNALDVSSLIKRVEVYVQISDAVKEEMRKNIQNTLDNLQLDLNGVRPSFNIAYTKMGSSYATKQMPVDLKEKLELYSKYSIMFGILAAILIASLVALFLMARYAKLQRELSDKQAPNASPAPAQAESTTDKEKDAPRPEAEATEDDIRKLSGIQRFRKYLANAPRQASFLVKTWIKSENQNHQVVLNALVLGLENDELLNLFSHLTDEERNVWKSAIKPGLKNKDFIAADAAISEEIIDDILSPQFIKDEEVVDMLLGLKTHDAKRLVEENIEMGGILLNALNTSLISSILNALDQEKASMAIDASMNAAKEISVEDLESFKEVLKEYQGMDETSPFIQKILQLFPLSTPHVEAGLFRALAANSYNKESFKQLCYEYLPSEIIHVLPEAFLKPLLQNYPMKQKAELVFVLDENKAKALQDIFAPAGSRAFDMLNFELETINESETMKNETLKRGESIWSDFLHYGRQFLQKNPDFKIVIAEDIEKWQESLYNGQGEAAGQHLRLVS